MDTASKDVLFTIAMNLELPDLLKWCESNSKIHRDVCNNDNVWRSKLLADYPDYRKFNLDRSLREIYVFLYQLSLIKILLNTKESLYEIFLRKEIDLKFKQLTKVPAFDLPNLEILNLSDNNLRKVPAFNLPNLKYLYLNHNQLEKIPPFNLPNLRFLYINSNKLTAIPDFILPNLWGIHLYNNKFSPKEHEKIYKKFPNKVR